MSNNENSNDLQEIITQYLERLKAELGDQFDINKINLAAMERGTGISRGKLRGLQKNEFVVKPHGNKGRHAEHTVLSGFTGVLDALLRDNVTNSEVCLEKLQAVGYAGGKTMIKDYITAHKDLIPPKRMIVAPQGSRGQRYQDEPGTCYQMDWGFINVTDGYDNTSRIACFAMVCHHCGEFYIEFFPNARQENLFIGMIHAFMALGVPERVLTDNMKSVVLHRDDEGHPVWHPEYQAFMKAIGFTTRLCKPRHPFTKGQVERLIQYVKGNFLPGRVFSNITDFNYQARRWCDQHNKVYHKTIDGIPELIHTQECRKVARTLEVDMAVRRYLCPRRSIDFDGFVNYEDRRFGVPYSYTNRICRVSREDFTLHIYSEDLSCELVQHPVTWSRKDRFCEDQYPEREPEELPTEPVKVALPSAPVQDHGDVFARFHFDKEVI